VYWFEIFECVRKISLIGLPVFFAPGTMPQLILGLMICFLSFGAYMALGPFTLAKHDYVSQLAQLQIFFTLLSGVVFNTQESDNPESKLFAIILMAICAVPPGVTAFLVSPLSKYVLDDEKRAKTRKMVLKLRKKANIHLQVLSAKLRHRGKWAYDKDDARHFKNNMFRRKSIENKGDGRRASEIHKDEFENSGPQVTEVSSIKTNAMMGLRLKSRLKGGKGKAQMDKSSIQALAGKAAVEIPVDTTQKASLPGSPARVMPTVTPPHHPGPYTPMSSSKVTIEDVASPRSPASLPFSPQKEPQPLTEGSPGVKSVTTTQRQPLTEVAAGIGVSPTDLVAWNRGRFPALSTESLVSAQTSLAYLKDDNGKPAAAEVTQVHSFCASSGSESEGPSTTEM